MVDNVQKLQQYILHAGTVQAGTLAVGDRVTMAIDKVYCFVGNFYDMIDCILDKMKNFLSSCQFPFVAHE